MGLSDLDGFLTGIVVGPELILPGEWLPVIWGGDSPKFKNAQEAQSIVAAIMERYNENRPNVSRQSGRLRSSLLGDKRRIGDCRRLG
jgi:uncharacterized protein